MDMILRNMVIATGISGLASTNQTFYRQDSPIVPISLFFLLQVTHDFTIANLNNLVGTVGKELVETVDEVHIEAHLFICHSDIAGSLVGNVDIMFLLFQAANGATHGDDIIIRMR